MDTLINLFGEGKDLTALQARYDQRLVPMPA